jgi:hypothetical protein
MMSAQRRFSTDSRRWHGASTTCAVAALAIVATPLCAQELRLSGGGCASTLHLVARDVPLSGVLKRLSERLDFKLSFGSETDPLVTVDTTLDPGDLLLHLADAVNFSVVHAPDPRCPGRNRIIEMTVLPAGKTQPRMAAALPSARPPMPVETPEQKRIAQEGLDAYLVSHGMDPAQTKRAIPARPGNRTSTAPTPAGPTAESN